MQQHQPVIQTGPTVAVVNIDGHLVFDRYRYLFCFDYPFTCSHGTRVEGATAPTDIVNTFRRKGFDITGRFYARVEIFEDMTIPNRVVELSFRKARAAHEL